ncbi:hydrogenobyrinic acid a,c-diamide synthase (glutamine-hydrolysing) /cobyrinate a,c-diamide synthase [Methylomonas methanica]|uniref:Cobyrinate a,c-diamide synthase n=3 Tax=Methylococcaceae TaxID=403 RepID=A0A140E5H9_9GAMM|nr:cobyrinic acid a,c-diamide synthase [Methylomonas denitrificans]OAH96140.1 cobyrinic acid a,c-diamide synthase [Methylomonas methanica]TCV75264.1 hydrogenobyrinic acid a,c-diamide synthase (glutamine-hydrolysing) /cobyrinate a,c-diamide synthase [Methylomonas methanica]
MTAELRSCPAMLISAPASGQGKTTVTAALAYYHRQQGRRVRVFKTGPDFIDPQILAFACGQPVYQLDLWMMGEAHCREMLYRAAGDADLILIEGVMGLFDGDSSSADLAQALAVPVAAVIDAQGMAQTFAAVAYGLANYRPGLAFAGAIANKVGSAGHAKMLQEALPDATPLLAAMARDEAVGLPSRHLGLLQAEEIGDLNVRLARAAELLNSFTPCLLPEPVTFADVSTNPPPRLLQGKRIAVARDAAFSFLYQANLDCLQAMGAELMFFSPLADSALPEADSVYLPGGYPELHLQVLASNTQMKQALTAHHQASKPLYAECGGFLYLLDSLADKEGHQAAMVGLLPGNAVMQSRLVNLGMHSLQLEQGEIRGHSFHFSKLETALEPFTVSSPQRSFGHGEGFFRKGSLQASYLHLYFPYNPQLAASFF